MQPAVFIYGLFGLLGHLVVALHHVVAAGADLALLPRRDLLAALRVHDLDLDLWQSAPDGRDPPIYRVVGPRLGDDRARFGLAVGDGDLLGPHIVDDLAHHLLGAGSPGHDPGAQRGGVVRLV